MRLPWPAIAGGAVVAAVGAAGLIRGAMPPSSAAPSGGTGVDAAIVITGAYIRAPVPPTQSAAAYFTVYNTTGAADRLLSVQTGAGATAILHTEGANGAMSAAPNGAVIPAHGHLTLSTGRGHVMIEQLYGRLKPGEHVDLELDFAQAGSIDITAPVVAVGAPVPTPSGVPS